MTVQATTRNWTPENIQKRTAIESPKTRMGTSERFTFFRPNKLRNKEFDSVRPYHEPNQIRTRHHKHIPDRPDGAQMSKPRALAKLFGIGHT